MNNIIFEIDHYDAWSYITIGIFSALSSIIFFIITYAFKKARQFPGNLILWTAFFEFLFSILNVIQGGFSKYFTDNIIKKDDLSCNIIGFMQFLCFNSIYFFQIFFMIAIVYMLQNSLKSMKYKYLFQLIPFLFVIITQFIMSLQGSFGMNIHGNCGYKYYDSNVYMVLFSLIIYIVVFIWTLINLFSYKNISFKIILNRKDFIQFYIQYCVMYFCYFIIIGMQLFFDFFSYDQIKKQNITVIKIFYFSKIINTFKIYLPLMTLIIRLKDPYIKKLFEKIYQKKICENTTFKEAFNLSNQDFLVNKTQKQIKIEITYAILFSLDNFYRFWLKELKNINEQVSNLVSINLNDIPEDYFFDKDQNQSFIFSKKIQYEGIFELKMQSFNNKKFYNIIQKNQMEVSYSFDLEENEQQVYKAGQMSGGKGGEFFLMTYDQKYIIKTITQKEFQCFQNFIQNYFDYLNHNTQTYLSKIIGLFCIQFDSDNQIYLVVMQNIFQESQKYLKQTFDLKGSRFHRRVLPKKFNKLPDKEQNELLLQNKVLQDKDFDNLIKKIILNPYQKNDLMVQILKDIKFLRDQKLIDYSLLVGIIDLKKHEIRQNQNSHLQNIYLDIKNQQAYIFGIIDYFQQYTLKKKLERFIKKYLMCKENNDISVTNPVHYSDRFFSAINHRIKFN